MAYKKQTLKECVHSRQGKDTEAADRGSHTTEHVKQTIAAMLNACEIDKQRVHIILRNNIRNMKKNNDDMEEPSVSCISHTSAGCTQGSAVTVQCHRLTC